MPSASNLYTLGGMITASSHNATPGAQGHPIEHALDFNLNTYWAATTTATQYIEIDLGESTVVDDIGFWIHNHDDLSGTWSFECRHSSNGSSWTRIDTGFTYDPSDHVVIVGIGAQFTKRYVKFEFYSQTTVLRISHLCCFRKWDIDIGNQYPENDEASFHNKSIRDTAGNALVAGTATDPAYRFSRQFMFDGTTNWNKLNSAFLQSCGSRYPLVVEEDSAFKIVRFAQDSLSKNEIDNNLFAPTVTFQEQVMV